MPSDPGKFHQFPIYLTEKEWGDLSAEAYSREISRGEIVRRALAHYFKCQQTKIAEVVRPPKKWRMPRPTTAAS